MDLAVFLPCRAGSQRVKKKNVRPFAGINGGLTQIKMEQLLGIKEARVIMVSTNDPLVVDIVRKFDDQRIVIDNRPGELASSNTSTDDLIRYVPSVLNAGHILWTHVTSPFLTASIYNNALSAYQQALSKGYDSLMSVTPLHKFIWNNKGPLYDVSKENWPRTQTIEPLYEVNSGIFITSRDIYLRDGNRIGQNPFFYEMGEDISFDVDLEVQFSIAEKLYYENFKLSGQ